MPEADREIEKAPLSIARNSSIPALDLAEDIKIETESLHPIFQDKINNAFDTTEMKELIDSDRKYNSTNKKSFSKSQFYSLAKVGINLDKPFGMSPFAEVTPNRTRMPAITDRRRTMPNLNII